MTTLVRIVSPPPLSSISQPSPSRLLLRNGTRQQARAQAPVTDHGVSVGGKPLASPAGNYTLYTLPARPGKPWMLIISKQTGQWGTEYH